MAALSQLAAEIAACRRSICAGCAAAVRRAAAGSDVIAVPEVTSADRRCCRSWQLAALLRRRRDSTLLGAPRDDRREFSLELHRQQQLVVTVATTVTMYLSVSAGLMPTEARGNYLPEPPYLRETKTYHSQPLESIRHAGNYFVPISIRPIFCCRSYVKLLDY